MTEHFSLGTEVLSTDICRRVQTLRWRWTFF